MPGSGKLRRPVVEVDHDGWRLLVVDPMGMVAAAAQGSVDLVLEPGWPELVQRAEWSLSVAGAAARLDATIHCGPSASRPYLTTLGNGPLGTLLKRRVAAGDERAVRIVDGLQVAVDRVNGLISPPPSVPGQEWTHGPELDSAVVIDEGTGLRTTVTRYAPRSGAAAEGARVIGFGTTLDAGRLTADHLAAFFGVMMAETGHRPPATFTLSIERGGSRTTLDQVGGLDDVVALFRDVALSFRNPAAMARWGAQRPQGILLYGPAGTGKTMLARALADEIGGTLQEIRTPDILDKWLGASERNLKRIFAEARRYREPTVLLFDEFDSIIGYAGAGGDSGSHAINAVAGLFKQEMNNLIEQNPYVIVVATTNFPQVIDASLVRSGRFDVKVEIPPPDAAGRAQILTRMMRGLVAAHETADFSMFADDVDIDELAALTVGMVGADLRELLRRAQLAKAIQEVRSGVAAGPIQQFELRAAAVELSTASG